MSDKYTDLFNRIEDSVQQFTSPENLENLRNSVTNTINDVRESVQKTAQEVTKNFTATNPNSYTTQTAEKYRASRVQPTAHPQRKKTKQASEDLPLPENAVSANKGRASATLLTVFGAIGTVLFGIATLSGLADLLFTLHFTNISGILSPLLLALVSVGMFSAGIVKQERLHRYGQYLHIIGRKTVCAVKTLAGTVHKSEKFVVRELKYLIKHDFFPHGRLDGMETSLILDDKTYQQYLDLQQRMAAEKQESDARNAVYRQNPELQEAIEHGNAVIREIKETNDAIPDEVISAKLARLEDVTGKIFSYVEAHPQKLADIRKFMEYYLPTTLKLVRAYRELDAQTIQGETILSMKNEIKNTLDTINEAFENMFDNLFLSDAVDISADISVLETMLHQEGLTEKDFTANKS